MSAAFRVFSSPNVRPCVIGRRKGINWITYDKIYIFEKMFSCFHILDLLQYSWFDLFKILVQMEQPRWQGRWSRTATIHHWGKGPACEGASGINKRARGLRCASIDENYSCLRWSLCAKRATIRTLCMNRKLCPVSLGKGLCRTSVFRRSLSYWRCLPSHCRRPFFLFHASQKNGTACKATGQCLSCKTCSHFQDMNILITLKQSPCQRLRNPLPARKFCLSLATFPFRFERWHGAFMQTSSLALPLSQYRDPFKQEEVALLLPLCRCCLT